jgi:hypothetical protein
MHYSYSLLLHSTAAICFGYARHHQAAFLCLLSYIKTRVDVWHMPRSLLPVVVVNKT